MATETAVKLEKTLDPEDWSEMRALGRQMVDEMLSYLETIGQRPVWQRIPEPVRTTFSEPLPLEGVGAPTA